MVDWHTWYRWTLLYLSLHAMYLTLEFLVHLCLTLVHLLVSWQVTNRSFQSLKRTEPVRFYWGYAKLFRSWLVSARCYDSDNSSDCSFFPLKRFYWLLVILVDNKKYPWGRVFHHLIWNTIRYLTKWIQGNRNLLHYNHSIKNLNSTCKRIYIIQLNVFF